MKRRELIRHLNAHGCELLREGANHSIFVNAILKRLRRFPGIASLTSSWPGKFAAIFKYRSPETFFNPSRSYGGRWEGDLNLGLFAYVCNAQGREVEVLQVR